MKSSLAGVKEIIRYKTIDQCLRANTLLLLGKDSGSIDIDSEKSSTLRIEDLIQACNGAYLEHGLDSKVSRSWVFEDIAFLKNEKGLNAPITTRRVNRVADYYYADPTFSLHATEWFRQLAYSSIERYLDIYEPEKIPASSALMDLRAEILSQISEYNNSRKIIYRSNDPLIKWHKWFDLLYRAIINRQALEISYQPFLGEAIHSIIHPQIIKEYNRRYFLFAINQEGEIRNFPLDRITSVAANKTIYVLKDLDWEEFFDELVGVTKLANEELTQVVLRMPIKEAKYFESKPIINGQIKIDRHDNYYDFSFSVYPNLELENVIMSYLPNMKVLQPDVLKERIQSRIQQSINSNL